VKSRIALAESRRVSMPVPGQRGWDSPADEPSWVIEELMPHEQVLQLPGPDRRVAVACALTALIVGLGLVGQWLDGMGPMPVAAVPAEANLRASPAPTPSAALTIVSPADGDEVTGAIVEVRGVAREPLGTIHLAIRLGDAVLGWKNLDVGHAGPIAAAIDVFAPPFDVPVELLISRRDGPESTVRRSIHLRASGWIQVWRSTLTRLDGGRWLTLEGVAPLTVPELRVRVYTGDGELFGDTVVPNGPTDELAGAAGGRLLGLGRFRASFSAGDTSLGDNVRIEISWPDPFGGPLGNVSESVIVAVPSLAASSS